MSSTIAALASGNSEAAIAIVRISGPNVPRVLKRALGLNLPPARTAVRAKYRNSGGEILDDVLATFFKAPASYTGEDCAEIYCHGSLFIVQNILQDLFANECEPAQPGDFTRRAFMNGKMDLSQAEAVALVIGARSKRALEAAQRQLDGELGRRIGLFSSRLLDACALAEAYIDFPEDDLPPEDKSKLLQTCRGLSADMRALADTSKYSALIHNGLNVVIAGAPNAGKSSLLNALTASDRAIVSPHAGTTRDFICEKIVLEDCCVNIIDTAGLRDCAEQIEGLGVEIALKKIRSADMRLLVIDASEGESAAAIPDGAREGMSPENTLIALNKLDLMRADSESSAFQKAFPGYECVRISCRTGEGIEKLKRAIVQTIRRYHIRAAADDILVSARHAGSLLLAADALDSASQKIADGAPAELSASDLRCALDRIGEIVGRFDSNDILDKIFSNFCIGK